MREKDEKSEEYSGKSLPINPPHTTNDGFYILQALWTPKIFSQKRKLWKS